MYTHELFYRIKINFNINHTVDADSEPDLEPSDDKVDMGEMKSKPNFAIDIIRRNQTLGFSCSFNNEPGASGAEDSYSKSFEYKKNAKELSAN